MKSAEDRGLRTPASSNFEYQAGRGIHATVEGRQFAAGGPNMLSAMSVEPDAPLKEAVGRAAAAGQSTIFLIEGKRVLAAFAVADAIRPESREAIRRLHEMRIEVVMITGDSKAVADAVAKDLGIDTVFAQVLPEDKAKHIEGLQQQGKRSRWWATGCERCPRARHLGRRHCDRCGHRGAVEAGDIVLVRSDPRDVPRIVALSRASYRKMLQNLWWAAGYNIFAIPLAAGVAIRWEILLSPAVAAILMSLSTVIVAINAQLLRRARL